MVILKYKIEQTQHKEEITPEEIDLMKELEENSGMIKFYILKYSHYIFKEII